MIVWPFAWLTTSALLVASGIQYGPGWLLPVVYVGLNAAAIVSEWLQYRRLGDRFMTRFGWAAALQLPVMLWILRAPERAPQRAPRAVDTTDAAETDMPLPGQRRPDERG